MPTATAPSSAKPATTFALWKTLDRFIAFPPVAAIHIAAYSCRESYTCHAVDSVDKWVLLLLGRVIVGNLRQAESAKTVAENLLPVLQFPRVFKDTTGLAARNVQAQQPARRFCESWFFYAPTLRRAHGFHVLAGRVGCLRARRFLYPVRQPARSASPCLAAW